MNEVEIPGFGEGWIRWGEEGLEVPREDSAMEEAFGRGGVVRRGGVVIRPYRRGGLVRHLSHRTYRSPLRFLREAWMHRILWEAGLPTVRPLGCAWRRRGLGVEGLYFTRWTESRPWPRSFEAQASAQVRRILEALSHWGCWVPDLNATNLLVDPVGKVLVLDFDRARFRKGDLMAPYRQRLLRSMRKLAAPAPLLAEVAGW